MTEFRKCKFIGNRLIDPETETAYGYQCCSPENRRVQLKIGPIGISLKTGPSESAAVFAVDEEGRVRDIGFYCDVSHKPQDQLKCSGYKPA